MPRLTARIAQSAKSISTRPEGHICIYVKSSITGDENDYIVDYKRRFPSYPHETTADQLFSEEQFEVYRALGFHAVNEVFSGRDQVGMRPKAAQWQGPVLNDPLVKAAKELLNWPDEPFHSGKPANERARDQARARMIPSTPRRWTLRGARSGNTPTPTRHWRSERADLARHVHRSRCPCRATGPLWRRRRRA